MKQYAIVGFNKVSEKKEFICHCDGIKECKKKISQIMNQEYRDYGLKYSNFYIIEDKVERECCSYSVHDGEWAKDIHKCKIENGDILCMEEIFDDPEY